MSKKYIFHYDTLPYAFVRKVEFPMSYPFLVPLKWIKNARKTLPSTKQFLCYNYIDHTHDPDWNAKGNYRNFGYVTKVVIVEMIPRKEEVKEEKPKNPPGPTAAERFEKIQQSFQQAIDNILDKSPVIRMNSIRKLTNIMIHNYLPSDFLNNYSNQLINQIKRLLRNGSKPMEKELASIMLPVLLLQSPSSFNFDGRHHQVQQLQQNIANIEIDIFNKDLNALLLAIIKNTINSCDIRGKCCVAITMIKFVDKLSEDDDGISQLMQTFEKIIIQIINNNNNNNQNIIESDSSLSSQSSKVLQLNENDYSLIATVLNCWAILFTLISPNNNYNVLTTNSIELFIKLLECSNLNVRLITGKIIALLFEVYAVNDSEDEMENIDSIFMEYLSEIMDIVECLASERNKYRTKRDLNKQHKIFRDIKQFLKDGIYRKIITINYGPEVSLDYGREFIKINSWFLHFRYGFLCKSIGSGITVHLMGGNQFVRDILELGDVREHRKLFCGENKNFRRYRRAVKRINRNFSRIEDRSMKHCFGCV